MEKKESKKKILFAVDLIESSGIIAAVNGIAKELQSDEKYDVSLLCTGVTDRNKVSQSIKVYDLDLSRYGNRQKYIHLIPALKSFFKEHFFDYVVVSGMEFVPFYYLAIRNKKIRKIAWEHRNFNVLPKYRLEWFGKRIACRKFDKIICLTKKDQKMYTDYCKQNSKIEQIYNLVDHINSENGYNFGSKKIMSAGFLDEKIKGYDLLVEVGDIVLKDNPEWSWDIYGEGKDKNNIQQRINNKNLQDRMLLKGHVDNIKELYKDYAIFVFTSRTEGLGMVLVEAQNNGLPVVSFDIECGPSDVIVDDRNGYLIRPFDVKKMAEKIMYLIKNDDMREFFSKNSRMLLAEFDKKFITDKWNRVFNEL